MGRESAKSAVAGAATAITPTKRRRRVLTRAVDRNRCEILRIANTAPLEPSSDFIVKEISTALVALGNWGVTG
jgi:hypothetical protein